MTSLTLPLSKRYTVGIKAFRKAFPGNNDELLYVLIANCEAARKYNWGERAARKKDTDALSDRVAAAKQAKLLAAYCRQYPSQLMLIMAAASQKSGVYLRAGDNTEAGKQDAAHHASAARQLAQLGRRNTDSIPLAPAYSVRLANLLEAFAGEIIKGNLLAKAGPFAHRWRHGPLGYAKPIENAAALPQAPVCLAIVLSFLLRRGTAYYLPGEQYDKTAGKPYWNIVSALITGAYPTQNEDHAAAAKAVLRRNPNIEILGWE